MNTFELVSHVVAQTGSAGMPLWRVLLAVMMAIAALAVAVGVSGFAQRWLLERVERSNLIGQGVFAIATVSGLILWLAAFVLNLVDGPRLSFSRVRPFTQGIAKCGVAMLAVSGTAMLLMAFRERSLRFGPLDGRRSAWRIGMPVLVTMLICILLLEPLLVRAEGPRPTNADFSISPMGYVFATLSVVMIAAAGAWCAAGSADGQLRRGLFSAGNWGVVLGLMPLSFVAYRLALRQESTDVAEGSGGEGWIGSWIRWCLMYGVAVAACWRAGLEGLRRAQVSETPQKPIDLDMDAWTSFKENLPWRKFQRRFGKKESSQDLDTPPPRRRSSAPPAPVPPAPRSRVVPERPSVALPAPVAKPREVPVPITTPAPPQALPVANAKLSAPSPVVSKNETEGDFLPIDPKTGLIRADVLERIEKELERDSSLHIVPHGRRSRRRPAESPPRQDTSHTPYQAPISPPPVALTPTAKPPRAMAEHRAALEPSLSPGSPASIPAYLQSRFRWLLLFALLAYVAMAYYASLVPLNYRAITWDQAVEQFRNIPNFDFQDNANRRADFIANIVLFVPIGFIAMGTAVFGRRSLAFSLVAGVFVFALSAALAFTIEFHQLWYPPRTVSQNDLVAEHAGAFIGIVAWLLVGQKMSTSVLRLMLTAGGQGNRQRLLQLFAIGLILFCLLPFDFTLSPGKIWTKVQSIRFGEGLLSGDLLAIGRLLRDVAVFAPLGFLAYFRGDRLPIAIDPKSPVRTLAGSAIVVLLVATVIECLKLFMVNGVVDLINIPTRTLGGLLGASIASFAFHADGSLRLTSHWPRSQRLPIAAILLAIYATFLICLLATPWRVSFGQYDFWKHMARFKAGLFINYYYSGEWVALANLTHYVLFFVPVGVILRWALLRRADVQPMAGDDETQPRGLGRYALALGVPLLAGLILGGTIEMLQTGIPRTIKHITAEQVAKEPAFFNQQAIDVSNPALSKGQHIETGPMPDLTDLLAYMFGAMVGWLLAGPFLQRGSSRVEDAMATVDRHAMPEPN